MVPLAAEDAGTPIDLTQLPGDLYAGPYGFLVAIALFAFLGVREFRRYREIDVVRYKVEIAELKADLEERTDELAQARDVRFSEAREADVERSTVFTEGARERERLLRENADLRALCARVGVVVPPRDDATVGE